MTSRPPLNYPEPAWPSLITFGGGPADNGEGAPLVPPGRMPPGSARTAALRSYKGSADYVLHGHGSPAVCFLAALQPQLQIIVGQGFGEPALRVISNHIQRDGFERL